MTPKEKAEELIDKYCDIGSIDLEDALYCASIAVDEILYVISLYNGHSDCFEEGSREYWQEVKKEIEKL
jgi:hypothetical protein